MVGGGLGCAAGNDSMAMSLWGRADKRGEKQVGWGYYVVLVGTSNPARWFSELMIKNSHLGMLPSLP